VFYLYTPSRGYVDGAATLRMFLKIISTRRSRSLTNVVVNVIVLVTGDSCQTASAAKTVEPIQMLFGMWTQVGLRSNVLGGGHYQQGMGHFGEGSTSACRELPAFNILNLIR